VHSLRKGEAVNLHLHVSMQWGRRFQDLKSRATREGSHSQEIPVWGALPSPPFPMSRYRVWHRAAHAERGSHAQFSPWWHAEAEQAPPHSWPRQNWWPPPSPYTLAQQCHTPCMCKFWWSSRWKYLTVVLTSLQHLLHNSETSSCFQASDRRGGGGGPILYRWNPGTTSGILGVAPPPPPGLPLTPTPLFGLPKRGVGKASVTFYPLLQDLPPPVLKTAVEGSIEPHKESRMRPGLWRCQNTNCTQGCPNFPNLLKLRLVWRK